MAAKEREQLELRELYIAESRKRKALHNELVELKYDSGVRRLRVVRHVPLGVNFCCLFRCGCSVARGNIRVYCRVRPILENEHRRAGPGQDADVTSFPVDGEIIVKQVQPRCRESSFAANRCQVCSRLARVIRVLLAHVMTQDETGLISKRFEFDNVFKPASTQEEVFAEVGGQA